MWWRTKYIKNISVKPPLLLGVKISTHISFFSKYITTKPQIRSLLFECLTGPYFIKEVAVALLWNTALGKNYTTYISLFYVY